MRRICWLPLLLSLGCSKDELCFGGGSPKHLVSPSDGAELRVPWVPLMLNLPQKYHDAEVSLCLDGEPWEDPSATLDHRKSWWGDGVDFLATLDLRDLEEGAHVLEARVVDPKARTLTVAGVFHVDHPPHRLTLRIAEGRAARVIVLKDGQPLLLAGPDMAAADPAARDQGLHSVFVVGEAALDLDPGRYTLIAVRSVLDDIDVVELEVDGDAVVELAVPPVIEASGWLTADLHVHTGRSGDAFVPNQIRWQSLSAAGLDVGVLTDHDLVTAPDATLLALAAARGAPHGVQGVEGSLYWPDQDGDGQRESIGHLNAFPVVRRTEAGTPSTTLETVPDHLAAWRQRQQEHPFEGQTELLLQLNHPRGIQFVGDDTTSRIHNLFGKEGFQRETPLGEGRNVWMTERSADGASHAMDFDAIELINRASWSLYKEVRADWFALMNQGVRITATGNSDSHAMESELVGFPLNLVACPPPALGEDLDMGCFMEAIQRGRVRVTTGPVLDLSVGGAGIGEQASGPGTAQLRVQAAPWVPVEELRLVLNGEVIERVDLSEAPRSAEGVLDLRYELPLPALDADAWLTAEAGRGLDSVQGDLGVYAQIAPEYSPIGFTNPVFIDVDGDGAWTPPGL
ncbi:MAG: CehA/McbA family metallohydrolase [Alphaproteobacteria bacterium]|nr:CehA/McbA family metallohydrolase [Alphaproteobacteria bacterium]